MSKKRRPIPRFEQAIIETHCHLDYLKDAPVQDLVEQAEAQGVERIITISVEPENLDTVMTLCRRFEIVYGTQGVHPHEAESFDAAAHDTISARLDENKIVAVGEIGLDYYYDHADRAVQRRVFEQQLTIAAEHDMPIVVHTREADQDTRAILAEFAPQLGRKGVIHSFTSSVELGEFCLEAGFYLGFNGIITFNRADNVRAVLEIAPLDRILIETDAPFLTPVPYRGKENAPHYLPLIAEKAAAVKQTEAEDFLKAVYANSNRLFF
jgi:TatD DNase family protein